LPTSRKLKIDKKHLILYIYVSTIRFISQWIPLENVSRISTSHTDWSMLKSRKVGNLLVHSRWTTLLEYDFWFCIIRFSMKLCAYIISIFLTFVIYMENPYNHTFRCYWKRHYLMKPVRCLYIICLSTQSTL
jgi:hypothetical protein